jgi:hypothetical protein
MKIFQPQVEDQEEGFATSFTFDSPEEQQSFADFLNNMSIGFLKSKFPVIDEGKIKYQTGFVVPCAQSDEAEPETVEEEVVEDKPKGKKKGKKDE